MRKINFYNYKTLYLNNKYLYDKVITKNLSAGEFILGKDLNKFEKQITNYLNVKYCLGLSDCTNALTLGLKSLNYPKNSKIIIPSHTFVATMNSVYNAGYIPVVCDINNFGKIDPFLVEKYLSIETKAIIAVNLNGEPCDYDSLIKITSKYKIDLIEDNAQGFGAKYKDKYLGTFGKFSALSFYPTKILGCFGDGGAILTNDYKIYKQVKLLRNHGRNTNNKVIKWGTNCRLDNIQAAILSTNLKMMTHKINKRRRLAHIYFKLLSKIDKITLPIQNQNYFSTYQNYEILSYNRDKLRIYLFNNGIETLVQWKGISLNNINLKNYKKITKFINTKYYFKRCLCLPINESLTKKDIEYICEKIRIFFS